MNELKIFHISNRTTAGVMSDIVKWANDAGVEIVSVVLNMEEREVYAFGKIV